MTERPLARCRILVVEDEYFLADEMRTALEGSGAIVMGPTPSVALALAMLDREDAPDGAILDLNLAGESAFPLADALLNRAVPVIFATGYDADAIPERFSHILRCEKPINMSQVTSAIGLAVAG